MSLVQQASLVNPQNSHFVNPGMSSKVGAVSGCGSQNSDLSLQQKGIYQAIKTGGMKKRHNKSKHNRRHRGGNGYGFSTSQNLSSNSGNNSNGSVHLASFTKYQNEGQNSDTNMNVSKQNGGNSSHQSYGTGGMKKKHNKSEKQTYTSEETKFMNKLLKITDTPLDTNHDDFVNTLSKLAKTNASKQKGGNSSDQSYGTGGNPYYAYKPTQGENLSVFAGSGYPPISRGLNSQCGGKKRKSRKVSRKSKKSKKSKKVSRKSRKGSRKSSKKRHIKKRQKGGYAQYMNNVANSHIYSTGAPTVLNSTNSALANPVPFTPKNDCMNTWKHLGDTPPYNKVM